MSRRTADNACMATFGAHTEAEEAIRKPRQPWFRYDQAFDPGQGHHRCLFLIMAIAMEIVRDPADKDDFLIENRSNDWGIAQLAHFKDIMLDPTYQN